MSGDSTPKGTFGEQIQALQVRADTISQLQQELKRDVQALKLQWECQLDVQTFKLTYPGNHSNISDRDKI